MDAEHDPVRRTGRGRSAVFAVFRSDMVQERSVRKRISRGGNSCCDLSFVVVRHGGGDVKFSKPAHARNTALEISLGILVSKCGESAPICLFLSKNAVFRNFSVL